jgi:peptide/nickel transport system substrate-binding protein
LSGLLDILGIRYEGEKGSMDMQGITARVRTVSSRRLRWRRSKSVISLTVLTGLLLACTPAAQPAATSAPAAAPTAAAAKPAATSAPAAAPTTAAAKPAATSAPAAAAKVQPKGSITLVLEAEPDTIQPKDGTTDNAMWILMNIYEPLVGRTPDNKLYGRLAETFTQSQSDPRTWRFKLRQGLKFTNGEPVNADAVVAMVNGVTNKEKPGLGIDEFGLTDATVAKIDDMTVDITTRVPDAIFPSRQVRMSIPAPQWLASQPGDAGLMGAIGTGPYMMTEYVRGSHFQLKANPNYWGEPKPTIDEIKFLFRNESTVRAAMLQAGEVQLASLLTREEAEKMPGSYIEQTGESVVIRVNPEHPVLKDLRVRQAINMSLDRKSMIDILYGPVAEHLNGMIVRKTSLGWNPELKEYPYDPAKAKQLIQEAGAVGQPIELVSRNGVVPRVEEVTELFQEQVSQSGLKVSVRSLEVGQWRTALRAVKPGDTRTDLQLTAVSDPVLDSSRAMINYLRCGGVQTAWCDQEFTNKLNNVLAVGGDARVQGFRELWATAYEQNVMVPLYGLNFVHGQTPKLKWGPPRTDLIRAMNEWTLED